MRSVSPGCTCTAHRGFHVTVIDRSHEFGGALPSARGQYLASDVKIRVPTPLRYRSMLSDSPPGWRCPPIPISVPPVHVPARPSRLGRVKAHGPLLSCEPTPGLPCPTVG